MRILYHCKKEYGFKTEWTVAGDAAARTITLPLYNSGTFNCTVRWGDGNISHITSYDSADRIHTYATSGTFIVEITGECPGWSFNNGGDRTKITDIVYWGHPTKFGGFQYLASGFYGCQNIKSYGIGKILAKSGLTDLSRVFQLLNLYANNIPSGLFDNCINVTTFQSAFYLNYKLTSIPSGLFDYNTKVTNFQSTFQSCKYSSIPSGLFDNCPDVTTFYATFAQTSALTTIPTGLFDNCPDVITFYGIFLQDTGLTTIPSGLFDKNTLVQTFAMAFSGCTHITAIPTGLFDFNGAVIYMSNVFDGCSVLAAIPTGLFDNNIVCSRVDYAFRNCPLITSIPSGLFDNLPANGGYYFTSTFEGTNITSIPTGLFNNQTSTGAAGFSATFKNCKELTTVPIDLFKNDFGSINTFYETFSGCIKLETVPADLFRYNTSVYNLAFYRTFYGCTKLQVNKNIFYADGEQSTRFLNTSLSFKECFYRTSFDGTQGEAPDLWNCVYTLELNLDVAPATNWEVGDIITGQTSGVTSVVVAYVTTKKYRVKQLSGTYTLGEVLGVTGVPAKLADQGVAFPTTLNYFDSMSCFGGAGNSLTSISNYGLIPAGWK